MKREKTLWEWWRTHIDTLPDAQINRIESVCSAGFPDVCGMYRGVPVFIELKHAAVQIRSPIVDISSASAKTQTEWHRRHRNAGGKSYLFMRLPQNKRFLCSSEHFGMFLAKKVTYDMLHDMGVFITKREQVLEYVHLHHGPV